MDAFNYFPSCVYRDEHPEWTENVIKLCQKHINNFISSNPDSKDQNLLQGGDMSNDPQLRFLVDYLIESSYNILSEQGYDVEKYELFVYGLWYQGIRNNAQTNIHIHKNSQLSGWMFLETPEQGSYPVFYDPRMNKPMVELDILTKDSILTTSSPEVHFNNVLPGTIILANSWLQHRLTPNRTSSITSTIHFVISHKDKLCNFH